MGHFLADIPSPYYRVTTRAIVRDEQGRLLVVEDNDGKYELPGGGWEFHESLEDCLRRELLEELGVDAASVGDLWFAYRGKREGHAWYLRLCVPVVLASDTFVLGEGMRGAHFVTRDELLKLPLTVDEAPICEHVDKFWPSKK